MRNGNDREPVSGRHGPNRKPKIGRPARADREGVTQPIRHDDLLLGMTGDASLLGLDEIAPPAAPGRKQWAGLGLFVLMAVAMIATGLVVTAASDKKTSTLDAERARLEQSAAGRSEVLRTWIDSRLLAGRRLTDSHLVRLFVSDMALHPPGAPLPRSVLDQLPYFQALMADFARQNDLVRAAVLEQTGRILQSSPGAAMNVAAMLGQMSDEPAGWKHIVSPVRTVDQKGESFVIDVLLPFPKVQAADADGGHGGTALALTFPANDILGKILSLPEPAASTESLHLIQHHDLRSEMISLDHGGLQAAPLPALDDLAPGQRLDFGRRSIAVDQVRYALGEPVAGVAWTLIHTVTPNAALAPVDRFIMVASGIALATVLASSFGFAMLWWRRVSVHHQELAGLYRALAERLDKQRQFLSAVTGSISDWLTVSSQDDRYIYANPAFSTAVGVPAANILGRHRHDVLSIRACTPPDDGFDGLVAGEQVALCEIGERRHVVATASSQLRDRHGDTIGTVTVMRDQTDLVEQRQRRVRALIETIDAFVHTVERRDPFLLGHTRRLRGHAIAVGRRLGLGDDDLTALALAASLSQIGKIFIPDAILVKPERHDRRESEIMRAHIDHAVGILGRIDFGFPVVDILSQMHERLDGSGYPYGLLDTDIGVPGRILGVTDVFCARTAPRSYRDRLSAGHALYHLANNASRYDIKVIAALADVVSGQGHVDPADDPQTSFLDARVWQNLRRQDDDAIAAVA
jgi:HD-GYP domain-containing protein (c-di-GMP phosphodiesterase class II)